MPVTQAQLVAWKLAIVAVAVVGVFVLAIVGRLGATDAAHDAVLVVSGLLVALGLTGAGVAVGTAQGVAQGVAQVNAMNALRAPPTLRAPNDPGKDRP